MDSSSVNISSGNLQPNVLRNLSREVQECIENCTRCHQICEQTISHCLRLGGTHADVNHIRILRDCAQACTSAADFMLRDSDLHPKACSLCADTCLACAEDCEHLAPEDQMMHLCAEVCRDCAESCRLMSIQQ